MSYQHTSGRWISHDVTDDDDPDCGHWLVEIPETDGNTIIRLFFGDMEDNTGEDIANANLTAAAPDLLAALRGLLHPGQHEGPCDNPNGGACSKHLIAAWDREAVARKAIAKATGEAAT